MLSLSQLFFHDANQPFMYLVGAWTEQDQSKLDKLLKQIVPHEKLFNPPPYFNYWIFMNYGKNHIMAKRFTWDNFYIGGTWKKLEEDLIKEYSNNQSTESV